MNKERAEKPWTNGKLKLSRTFSTPAFATPEKMVRRG
jgi:hypothetical protein